MRTTYIASTLYRVRRHKYNSAMNTDLHKNEQGAISGSLIAIIGLVVLVIAAGSAAIWAYMNYTDQKNNVDSIVTVAVAKAEKAQFDADFTKFQEEEKQPNRQFVGPDDYGRLTFNYPKTWSLYVAKDVKTSGGTYEAYLNPVLVPAPSPATRYALRVTIEQRDYAQVVKSYEAQIKSGKLTSKVASVNGSDGTLLEGTFTGDIRGAAVVYKVRDKTVTIRTEADTFRSDFNALIQTIKFNE